MTIQDATLYFSTTSAGRWLTFKDFDNMQRMGLELPLSIVPTLHRVSEGVNSRVSLTARLFTLVHTCLLIPLLGRKPERRTLLSGDVSSVRTFEARRGKP